MTGVRYNFAPEHALINAIDCRLTFSAIRLIQDTAFSYQKHATFVNKVRNFSKGVYFLMKFG